MRLIINRVVVELDFAVSRIFAYFIAIALQFTVTAVAARTAGTRNLAGVAAADGTYFVISRCSVLTLRLQIDIAEMLPAVIRTVNNKK